VGKNAQRRRAERDSKKMNRKDIEDLVWDENNPITVNSCSGNELNHTDECDGNCEPRALTEMDVKLNNEMRAWARLGISPLSQPLGLGAPGMTTNLLDLEIKVMTLIEALTTLGLVESAVLDEMFQKNFLRRLHDTRVANEDKIKEERSKESLHVAQRRLLGPNGNPFEN
jgi:hypothetical protein